MKINIKKIVTEVKTIILPCLAAAIATAIILNFVLTKSVTGVNINDAYYILMKNSFIKFSVIGIFIFCSILIIPFHLFFRRYYMYKSYFFENKKEIKTQSIVVKGTTVKKSKI